MVRTQQTVRLTRNARRRIEGAAGDVLLRVNPKHDLARAEDDDADEGFEMTVHGHELTAPQAAWRTAKGVATGGGRLSFALLGASIFLIIFLQLCVLATENESSFVENILHTPPEPLGTAPNLVYLSTRRG